MQRERKKTKPAIGIAFALAMAALCNNAHARDFIALPDIPLTPLYAPTNTSTLATSTPSPNTSVATGAPRSLMPQSAQVQAVQIEPAPVGPIQIQQASLEPMQAEASKEVNVASIDQASIDKKTMSRDAMIYYVMDNFEGSRYVPNDSGRGPSKCGILGSANDLTPKQVKALTRDKCAGIYKNSYWDPLNLDNLPTWKMRFVALDTAIQFGTGAAQCMIAQSQNNPTRLLDIADTKYRWLLARYPERYKGVGAAWASRQATLRSIVGGEGGEGENPLLTSAVFKKPHGFFHRHSHNVPQLMQANLKESFPHLSNATLPSNLEGDAPHVSKSVIWSAMAAPLLLLLLLGRRKRPKKTALARSHPRHSPLSSRQSPRAPVNARPRFAETAARTTMPASAKPAIARPVLYDTAGLCDAEYRALNDVFGPHNPVKQNNNWQVNYDAKTHVNIKNRNLEMQGDQALEDSLIYAAKAWGKKCVIKTTPEMMEKIKNATQKLVNEGALPSGFTIEGVGQFNRQIYQLSPHRPVTMPPVGAQRLKEAVAA